MTIVTQDGDLLNYDAVKKVSVFGGTVESEDGKEIDIFAIIAFDISSDTTIVEDFDTEGTVQLGIYGSESESRHVVRDLLYAIERGQKTFLMPEANDVENVK